jgi:L-aspartate oxidase
MTHLPGDFLAERFPNIHERCLSSASTCGATPIPVVPAAHYMCGGVMTGHGLRGRAWATSTPWARSRARACMAPTAWPATACSRGWSSPTPLTRSRSTRRVDRTNGPSGLPEWDPGSARESGRGRDHLPELERDPDVHVELRRASCAAMPALPAPGAASRLLREEIHAYYWNHHHHARPARAAQPGPRRRPHHPLRLACARRAGACTSRPTTPSAATRGSGPTRFWMVSDLFSCGSSDLGV